MLSSPPRIMDMGSVADCCLGYTFAVRNTDAGDGARRFVNIGKAYSGVTDVEIAKLTSSSSRTIEDHGHVRAVDPVIVMEVAFNNVQRSNRHDSGFALRFPRIVRLLRTNL